VTAETPGNHMGRIQRDARSLTCGCTLLQRFVQVEDRVHLGGLAVRMRATDCFHALLKLWVPKTMSRLCDLGRGADRGRRERPGDRETLPGVADVGEPVAADAGGRRKQALASKRGRRVPVQADPGAAARARGGAGCRAGRLGWQDQCWTLATLATGPSRSFCKSVEADEA
jgi:hypothetical protein